LRWRLAHAECNSLDGFLGEAEGEELSIEMNHMFNAQENFSVSSIVTDYFVK
jgi:hypothetical protein